MMHNFFEFAVCQIFLQCRSLQEFFLEKLCLFYYFQHLRKGGQFHLQWLEIYVIIHYLFYSRE